VKPKGMRVPQISHDCHERNFAPCLPTARVYTCDMTHL